MQDADNTWLLSEFELAAPGGDILPERYCASSQEAHKETQLMCGRLSDTRLVRCEVNVAVACLPGYVVELMPIIPPLLRPRVAGLAQLLTLLFPAPY